MESKKFIYYKEDDTWIGWLEEDPDYRTQGYSLEELKDNLKELYHDLGSGDIPCVRIVGELMVG